MTKHVPDLEPIVVDQTIDFTQNHLQSPNTARVSTVLGKICKWNKLQKYGTPLANSRLIPCKTPIDNKHICSGMYQWSPFSPELFYAAQEKEGRILGCIIDLTNHEMIYDVSGLNVPRCPKQHAEQCTSSSCTCEKMPIQHKRIKCVSKEFPELNVISAFTDAVNVFLQNHPNHYVGVHCSYGFNRTGFIVCSYLAEYYGMNINDAVDTFAASRAPGIKHKWFVDELVRRYGKKESRETCLNVENVLPLYNIFESCSSSSMKERTEEICIN